MDLYFSGGETSDHRKRLLDAGVKNVALSFWGLQKRLKDPAKTFDLAEKFPHDVNILVNSGAFSASKKADYTDDDWINYVDKYMDFVELNIDRITMVTEFDATVISHADIEQMREDFWNNLPSEKFMPVWHEAHGGLNELAKLGEEYDLLAITSEAFAKRNITARLNNLAGTYGTLLHGMGITKPDELREIRFDSVSSTSWVSPMQFGDTIVWDGTRLIRYPVKYKEKARKRHRMLFEKHGFDAEKIANDDPNEVTAFSIWSWLRFEEKLNQRQGKRGLHVVEDTPEDTDGEDVAATWDLELEDDPAEVDTPGVAISPPEERNLPALRDEPPTMLPVFGLRDVIATDEQGEQVGLQQFVVSQGESIRRCDTCHVAATCPKFTEGSTCAFSFPVSFQTMEQLNAGLNSIIEIQMQRIAFARFAEELEGGYPDPNVSTEMDRFFKLAKLRKDINDNRESLRIEVEAKGQAGVLSRIFGERNVPQAADIIDSDKAEHFMGEILEAEIVE